MNDDLIISHSSLTFMFSFDRLLRRMYEFPKPRNILGMAKYIPGPEMEKLILTHIEAREIDLRVLANLRGMNIRGAILNPGKI